MNSSSQKPNSFVTVSLGYIQRYVSHLIGCCKLTCRYMNSGVSYRGKEVGGVCPVHIPHWGGVVPQIQKPFTLMSVVVPTSRIKPVM